MAASPPKPALPASVANATREDLQRMLMDSLRKRKASDKRIADLTAEKESLLAAQAATGALPTENGGLQEEQPQQALKQQLAHEREQAELANRKLQEIELQATAWKQEIQAANDTNEALQGQLDSLKAMLRTEIEGKERFRTQAEGIAASAGRYESAARSARFSADKARAEMAVLEGALTGSKEELEAARNEVATLKEQLSDVAPAAEAGADDRVKELEAAVAAAHASAGESQARMDARVAELQELLAAAESRQAAIASEAGTAQQQLTGRLETAQMELQQAGQQLRDAHDRISLLDAQAAMSAGSQEASEQLRGQLQAVQAELQAASEQLREAAAREASLPDLESRNAALQQHLDAVQADMQTHAHEAQQLQQQASAWQERLEGAEAELQSSKEREASLLRQLEASSGSELRAEAAPPSPGLEVASSTGSQPTMNGDLTAHASESGDAPEALDKHAEVERLSRELADTKKRFSSIARKKQLEYSKKVKELEDQLAQSQQPEQAASSEDTIAQLNARASVAEQVQAKAQSSINTLQAELSSLREQLAEAQAEAASRAESAPQAIQPPEQPEETAGGVGAGAHLQGDVGEAEQLREEVAGLRIEARALVGQLREAQGREASLLQQQEQAEALRVGLEGERETALQEARSSREALRAAEDKLMALQANVAASGADAGALSTRAAEAEREAEEARQQQARAESQAEAAALQLEALQAQVGEQTQALSAAQASLQALTQQLHSAEAHLQEQTSVWAGQLEAARRQATDEGAAALQELQAKLVAAESQALKQGEAAGREAGEKLQAAQVQLEEHRQQMEMQAGQAQAQLQAMKHANQVLEQRLQEADSQLAGHRSKIQSTERELTQLQEAHTALQQPLAEAGAKLAAAEEKLAEAEQQGQQLQTQLEVERQSIALERSESGAQQAAAAGQLEQKVAEAVEEAQSRWRREQEAERERVKRAIAELKKKHDRAQKEARKAEAQALEAKAAAEAHLAEATSASRDAVSRVEQAQGEAVRMADELRDYKARAHALLKGKDAELRDARAVAEQHFADSLREAEQALSAVHRELAEVRKHGSEAQVRHAEALAAAAAASQAQVGELREAAEAAQADADAASMTADQWKRRHDALEARMEVVRAERRHPREASPEVLARHAQQVAALEQALAALQQEHDAFRTTAEEVGEAKDAELANVLATNASLREEVAAARALQEAPHGSGEVEHSPLGALHPTLSRLETAPSYRTSSFSANLGMLTRRPDHLDLHKPFLEEGWGHSGSLAGSLIRRDSTNSVRSSRIAESGLDDFGLEAGLQESALVRLAAQQAGREEELAAARRQASELESEVADLQSTLELHQKQAEALKEALREAERAKARQKLADEKRNDLEYLKNIMLKLFETGEAGALLPVIATMLHFSPAELGRCKEALARYQGEEPSDNTAESTGDYSAYFSGWGSWLGGDNS